MKILITTGETPIFHGLKAGEISQLAGADTQICVLASPLAQDDAQSLKKEGVRILPLADLIRMHALAAPPSFAQIFSRPETLPDPSALAQYYQGKRVLVTGGEGYIGSALIEALLTLPIENVTALGHGENELYRLIQKHKDNPRFSYILGDIRDEEKIRRSFERTRPHIVFHAAAHKHVPILEAFPEEAVKTNILASRRLAQIAGEFSADRFVMVSTDKAVNPASALGASKRIAEKICLSLDALSAHTRYCSVRFGNVFGSTGSAVPTFLTQLSEGFPLTLTDKNMMRYFMSVGEASHLVLLAGSYPKGSLFTLDMGTPVSMAEIAEKIFSYCGVPQDQRRIKVIGNRGGEKFSEELIHPFEMLQDSPNEKLIVLKDKTPLWNEKEITSLCAEFSEAASFGTAQDVFTLFDKYINRYAGAKR